MPQKQLPKMFDEDVIVLMGAEWELCRILYEGVTGHALKLRFGDEMLVVGLIDLHHTPEEKEREQIALWLVMRAAQFAEKGKK